jgi:hypothetical protein
MAAVYFADTFWWIAVANPKDAWHARVLAWEAVHPNARFVTTEDILSELLTWFAGTGPAGTNSQMDCMALSSFTHTRHTLVLTDYCEKNGCGFS